MVHFACFTFFYQAAQQNIEALLRYGACLNIAMRLPAGSNTGSDSILIPSHPESLSYIFNRNQRLTSSISGSMEFGSSERSSICGLFVSSSSVESLFFLAAFKTKTDDPAASSKERFFTASPETRQGFRVRYDKQCPHFSRQRSCTVHHKHSRDGGKGDITRDVITFSYQIHETP